VRTERSDGEVGDYVVEALKTWESAGSRHVELRYAVGAVQPDAPAHAVGMRRFVAEGTTGIAWTEDRAAADEVAIALSTLARG
jgi:hypothetical protein